MIFDHPVVPLLGRLMMAYIFATSGIAKVFGWSGNVAYVSTRHLPLIPVLLAFFAACARAYPYGGARVLAYAAPGLLLLVGAGTPPALAWLRARSRVAALAIFLFLVIPAGSALAHIVWPWGRADCR